MYIIRNDRYEVRIKNMRTLVLLTNYFPFYKGEEYLETEVPIMSLHFNKVYVFATMATVDMEQTRKVPDNFIIIRCGLQYDLLARCKMFFTKSKTAISDTEKINIAKSLYRKYYYGRLDQVLARVKDDEKWQEILNADFVVIYSYWLHITASVAVRLNQWVHERGVKTLCISRAHRYDLYDYASPLGYIPDRCFMLNNIDYVFPCSEDGAEYLSKHYPSFADKISVARLGTAKQEPITCSREPVFEMISCSGVRKVKRLDRIIHVVQILHDRGRKVHWTHIGDGDYKKNIDQLAAQKLENDCYDLIGRRTNLEVLAFYEQNPCSLFINLSDSEGIPVAIMEAAGRGIPVVATDVGGTREIVDNDVNGYIVSTNETDEEIAAKIEKIMDMKDDEYHSLCKASLDKWIQSYDADSNYREFYKRLEGNCV